jgi:hypothetical protein
VAGDHPVAQAWQNVQVSCLSQARSQHYLDTKAAANIADQKLESADSSALLAASYLLLSAKE